MEPLNILIVGCGIAGPTLASFLLSLPIPAVQKPRITIVERSPNLRNQGQNIDIRGPGVAIMRKLGIEGAVRSSTTGEEGVEWVDEDNRMWIALAADRTGKVSTPTADIEIMRGRLAQICYEQSNKVSDSVRSTGGAGIEFLFGESIATLEQDAAQVQITLKNTGQRRSFDLVVGADGLQSQVRRLAWGMDEEQKVVRPLGMYAAFFSLAKSRTDSMWRRWMHTSRRRGITLRPNQGSGNTTALIYVVNDIDRRLMNVALYRHGNVAAQKALMMEYFKDEKWENQRIMEGVKAADDFYYDFIGQVKLPNWRKGRVVLLGDAG